MVRLSSGLFNSSWSINLLIHNHASLLSPHSIIQLLAFLFVLYPSFHCLFLLAYFFLFFVLFTLILVPITMASSTK